MAPTWADRWPVLGRHERAAEWLHVWADLGRAPRTLLPAVHRVASLAKRWLLGTHQGAVDDAHLPGYLNEFTFRFNRRRSRSRGLLFYRVLELAAGHDPGTLPRPDRQPAPATSAFCTAVGPRPAAEYGAAPSWTALENG